MLLAYLGSDARQYLDYFDARTGRMLEVEPGGGPYDVTARDPDLPLPPGDGRWGPATVTPRAGAWTGASREMFPAQDAAAETPAEPEPALPSLPGESSEHEPESPAQDAEAPATDGGPAAPSTEE